MTAVVAVIGTLNRVERVALALDLRTPPRDGVLPARHRPEWTTA